MYGTPHTDHRVLSSGKDPGGSSRYHVMKCWQEIRQFHVVRNMRELNAENAIPMLKVICEQKNSEGTRAERKTLLFSIISQHKFH